MRGTDTVLLPTVIVRGERLSLIRSVDMILDGPVSCMAPSAGVLLRFQEQLPAAIAISLTVIHFPYRSLQ